MQGLKYSKVSDTRISDSNVSHTVKTQAVRSQTLTSHTLTTRIQCKVSLVEKTDILLPEPFIKIQALSYNILYKTLQPPH